MLFRIHIEHKLTDIDPAAVCREHQRLPNFYWLRRSHMCVPGNQNIQSFHLSRRLNIFIKRPPDICAANTGLPGRKTFMHQRNRDIDFSA
ncbi:hypothetical protein D3C72_2025070 [compost metagenome]